jgi:ubiquinone/menaquinone biosynthesis C-methylase UbiE
MPNMSRIEARFCRSRAWRAFAGNAILPWSLQGFEPHDQVLEIGAGSGAMAVELLARYSDIDMMVTDFDPAMVDAASARLALFGDRVKARQADATALPFPDASFDVVLSCVMLHHTLEWEKALAECLRVLRPGGHVAGYDLLSTAPLRLLHKAEGDHVRTMRLDQLRQVLRDLPVDQAILTPGLAGLVVRFLLRKQSLADHHLAT